MIHGIEWIFNSGLERIFRDYILSRVDIQFGIERIFREYILSRVDIQLGIEKDI